MQEKNLPGIITLMYHRVDRKDTDPWRICVSPDNFEKHIKILQSNFNVISINDINDILASGNLEKNSICITFDDGYEDNFLYAKPVLERYNCPATFFIATGYVDQPSFWWDDLEIIFLHLEHLPEKLIIEIMGKEEEYIINETELSSNQWLQHKRWRWYQLAPTSRCKIYLTIWEKLFTMDNNNITKIVNKIKQWAGYDENIKRLRSPLKFLQLRDLLKNKLFTIANHTHTHCNLNKRSRNSQLEEILKSEKYLKENYGIESHFFSYPFGQYNNESLYIVNKLQMKGCFTTKACNITVGTNKTELGRYQVFNWNGKTFEKQIRKWFTTQFAI